MKKMTCEKAKIINAKTPAPNERFCVIAAVSPQTMQCKLASYYPAASSVEAATTQSRHHVSRHQICAAHFEYFPSFFRWTFVQHC
jgi:hypothetical protein